MFYRLPYFNPYDINDIANKLVTYNNEKKVDKYFLEKYNWDDKAYEMIRLIEDECNAK